MWKQISPILVPKFNRILTRTFLSEGYKCTETWNQRLTSPILQNIDVTNFCFELNQRLKNGKVSAIDVDILANKISASGDIDSFVEVINGHRLTEETTNTLDSTGHAIVRLFLERSQIKELLSILDDRLNYGVFLDSYLANLCMDVLIKNKDFTLAARVATQMMLQEDFENEITKAMSLYSCWKYLENPLPFNEIVAPVETQPTQPTTTKKKVEEIKIRVKYLRNPYFDDHFDITDERSLVGKTILMIGELFSGRLANSLQLLGLGLRGKYDEGIELLLKNGSNIHVDVVKVLLKSLESIPNEQNEQLRSFSDKLAKFSGGIEDSFENELCNYVNSVVKECESNDIEYQKKTYADWCDLRETKLREELDRLNRSKRLEEIKKMTEDMATEEQRLWFFENEDKLDLEIDGKKVYYPKRWFGKKKKPRTASENYVPPEIRNRN